MLCLALRRLLGHLPKIVDCWLLFFHQVQRGQPHSQVARSVQQTHQRTGYSTACKGTGTGSEVSASLSYLALIRHKETSFWVICSFVGISTTLIFRWLKLVRGSLYFRVLMSNSQTAFTTFVR